MFALTFDDGPDPVWTEEVLAALARRGATATFFVEAPRARANPGLIEAMQAAGHEVGLHCVRHVRHSELDPGEVSTEAELGLAALADLGVRPRAWRTPWGIETEATREVATAHGLELCGWSFDSHDWRGDSSTEMLAALASEGGLRPGEVVLMHDAIGPGARRDGCEQTVLLADGLLAAGAAAGLRPATISALGEARLDPDPVAG